MTVIGKLDVARLARLSRNSVGESHSSMASRIQNIGSVAGQPKRARSNTLCQMREASPDSSARFSRDDDSKRALNEGMTSASWAVIDLSAEVASALKFSDCLKKKNWQCRRDCCKYATVKAARTDFPLPGVAVYHKT